MVLARPGLLAGGILKPVLEMSVSPGLDLALRDVGAEDARQRLELWEELELAWALNSQLE